MLAPPTQPTIEIFSPPARPIRTAKDTFTVRLKWLNFILRTLIIILISLFCVIVHVFAFGFEGAFQLLLFAMVTILLLPFVIILALIAPEYLNNQLIKRLIFPAIDMMETEETEKTEKKKKVYPPILREPNQDDAKPFLFCFVGNSCVYENMEEFNQFYIGHTNPDYSARINKVVINHCRDPKQQNDVIFYAVRIIIAEIQRLRLNAKKDIEAKIHLHGSSMGGAIALQVALYFKRTYGLDLTVSVERSFSSFQSISASIIALFSGLPKSIAMWWTSSLLKAAGNWFFDSVATCQALLPGSVYALNVSETVEDSLHGRVIDDGVILADAALVPALPAGNLYDEYGLGERWLRREEEEKDDAPKQHFVGYMCRHQLNLYRHKPHSVPLSCFANSDNRIATHCNLVNFATGRRAFT